MSSSSVFQNRAKGKSVAILRNLKELSRGGGGIWMRGNRSRRRGVWFKDWGLIWCVVVVVKRIQVGLECSIGWVRASSSAYYQYRSADSKAQAD